jgi:hypothetical protein
MRAGQQYRIKPDGICRTVHGYALGQRPLFGIMWVIFDHLRPSGHIMPDHAGDRGTVPLVLAPTITLHINHDREFGRLRICLEILRGLPVFPAD